MILYFITCGLCRTEFFFFFCFKVLLDYTSLIFNVLLDYMTVGETEVEETDLYFV